MTSTGAVTPVQRSKDAAPCRTSTSRPSTTESQPAFNKKVQSRVIDAALGTVEKGWYHNDDAANEQPWLPNGPIPHTVTWTLPGYEPPGVPYPGNGGRA